MSDTVGQILKKHREEKNLSLDQAARVTHIRKNYLEALENDRIEILPSAVQSRGFLRLYADFLGLSAKPLLDIWDGKTISEPESEFISPIENEDVSVQTDLHPEFPDTNKKLETNESERHLEISVPETITIEDQTTPLIEPAAEAEHEISESEKIFRDIGNNLKSRRENLGITFSDAEKFTHLRQAYLIALEEGRIYDLPSPVQCRGMLNNYAAFLELDTENVLLRFAEGLQTRRLENAPPSPATQPSLLSRRRPAVQKTKGLRSFLTPDLIIGGSIIIVIIFFAIWTAAQVSATRSRTIESTAPAFANLLQTTPTHILTPEIGLEITTTQTALAAENPINVIDNSPATLSETEGEGVTVTAPPSSTAPIQVYIVARQRAYLKIISDQKQVFNGRIAPGNAYPFGAEKTLELISGNAAALQVFYNQRDLGTLGIDGQVVRLIFDDAGITTPTPSASLTPTVTMQPSLTPRPTATPATPTVTPFIP